VEASDLNRRENTANDQRGRHQISLYLRKQIGGACQNDRRCDHTSQHRESMLKPKERGKKKRHLVIKAEEGRCSTVLLHEWKIGLEEECIVVFSNEAIPEYVSLKYHI
jgi:hypothetical protein